MEGKVCSDCGEWKKYGDFYKRKESIDGYFPKCKECVKKYAKRYYQKNADQIKEYKKRFYQENAEQYNERNKKLKSTEKYKKHFKDYYQRNIEKIKKRKAEYYQKNAEKIKQRQRQYNRTEQGKQKMYRSKLKRRSYKHKVYFRPLERKKILERDNWTCQNCGTWVHDEGLGLKNHPELWDNEHKAHIDHIIPISKGGSSEPSNLRVLCRTCNLTKSDKIDEQLQLPI